MKKIVLMFACSILLFGCTDYPKCSDVEVTDIVKSIVKEQLGHSTNNSILVEDIRTINRNDKTGRNECAATVIVLSNNTLYRRDHQITYTSEITEDTKQIYVTVYGFLF